MSNKILKSSWPILQMKILFKKKTNNMKDRVRICNTLILLYNNNNIIIIILTHHKGGASPRYFWLPKPVILNCHCLLTIFIFFFLDTFRKLMIIMAIPKTLISRNSSLSPVGGLILITNRCWGLTETTTMCHFSKMVYYLNFTCVAMCFVYPPSTPTPSLYWKKLPKDRARTEKLEVFIVAERSFLSRFLCPI